MVDFQKCVKNVYKSRLTTGGLSCLLSPSKTREPGLQLYRWKDMGPHHLGGKALAHFPFSGKYSWNDLGLRHHNLASSLTLYTLVRATVSFKCHDALTKFADQANLKCMK